MGSQSRKTGRYGHSGTLVRFLEVCYCDNLFTSAALSEELLKKHITVTGTKAPTNERDYRNFFRTPKGKSIEAFLGQEKKKAQFLVQSFLRA
jgi:hypothetical protein